MPGAKSRALDAIFCGCLVVATCYYNDDAWMNGPNYFFKEFLGVDWSQVR